MLSDLCPPPFLEVSLSDPKGFITGYSIREISMYDKWNIWWKEIIHFFKRFHIKCYIAVMVSISLWEWYKEWSSLYLRVTCLWQWTPVFMMRCHGVWRSPGRSPETAESHDWRNSNCSYLQKTINCSLNLFCSLCVKIMLWFDQKQNTKAIFATLRDCSGHWLDEFSPLWSQLNSNDVQGRQLKSNSG